MDGSKIESTAFIYERPKIDRQLVKEVTLFILYAAAKQRCDWLF